MKEDPAVSLLRASNAPVIAALLREHLGQPGQRLKTEELHELIDADLLVLRDHFSLGNTNAKGYCDQWRSTGLIIRRPDPAARGETYELSAGAHDALRILDQLEEPQITITESRLVALATSLHQLAIDTDPDIERRITALEEQKRRIDREILDLRTGKSSTLDDRRARERLRDVIQQSQALPADFARVRSRFEDLNQELRASIIATDDAPSSVLNDIFRGVDLISASEEGQTFAAFTDLVRDPEKQASFEDDVTEVLERDFSTSLSLAERRTVRLLMKDMKTGSRDVRTTLTDFARGLRRYVYSQQFHTDRLLRGLLQEAIAHSVQAARNINLYEDVQFNLELSVLSLSSIGQFELYDPSDFEEGPLLTDHEPLTVDFVQIAQVVRETEIDFGELIANVNHCFDRQDEQLVTVQAVLKHFPATQGIASVLGLLSLAATYGRAHGQETDELKWVGTDGIQRKAQVIRHSFTERLS